MALTLSDMIQELFAVKTAARISQVTVSNVVPVTQIADNNPNRLSLIISNPSDNRIHVSFERDFVVDEGIVLTAIGGFMSFLWSEDFDVVGWSMFGIAENAPSIMNVLEIISI